MSTASSSTSLVSIELIRARACSILERSFRVIAFEFGDAVEGIAEGGAGVLLPGLIEGFFVTLRTDISEGLLTEVVRSRWVDL